MINGFYHHENTRKVKGRKILKYVRTYSMSICITRSTKLLKKKQGRTVACTGSGDCFVRSGVGAAVAAALVQQQQQQQQRMGAAAHAAAAHGATTLRASAPQRRPPRRTLNIYRVVIIINHLK